MTSSKLDLQGAVTATAFEEVSGNSWLILVSAQGYQCPTVASAPRVQERFQVTMTATWPVSGWPVTCRVWG